MNHSYSKHKALFEVLNKTGQTDNRHEIIHNFTNGRTSSSKDLGETEIQELIYQLNGELPEEKDPRVCDMGYNKMVAKIFWLARQYGYTKEHEGKTIVDVKRLSEWTTKYGYCHKPFREYRKSQLPRLVSQFEIVVRSYLESL